MVDEKPSRRPSWMPGNATIAAIAALVSAVAALVAALQGLGPI